MIKAVVFSIYACTQVHADKPCEAKAGHEIHTSTYHSVQYDRPNFMIHTLLGHIYEFEHRALCATSAAQAQTRHATPAVTC